MDRRRFVVTLGTLSSTVVGGCLRLSASDSDSEQDGTTTESQTRTRTPTATRTAVKTTKRTTTEARTTQKPTTEETTTEATTTERTTTEETTTEETTTEETTTEETTTENTPEPTAEAWEVETLTVGKGRIREVTFTSEEVGWMAVGGSSDVGGNGGFYRTSDGGRSWRSTYAGDATEITVPVEGSRLYRFGSSPETDRHAWYSDDGGESWESFDVRRYTIDEAAFVTDEVGLMVPDVGRDVLWTEDGGQSIETFQPGPCNVDGVDQRGELVVAVGKGDARYENGGGCLLRSESAGEPDTWSVETFRDEAHDRQGGALRDAYVDAEGGVWVVGENRQIYYSAGGRDKTQIEDVPEEVADFVGVDGRDDHLVAVANDVRGRGLVYESVDGGENWTITWREAGISETFEGVEYVRPGLAYAYGRDGLFVAFTGRG